jgi:hypothetical protein
VDTSALQEVDALKVADVIAEMIPEGQLSVR